MTRRLRRSAVVGVTAAAVVAGGASAALATPVSAPDVTVLGTWLQPVLVGQATDPYASGSQSLVFYARHVGASTWDLLNGYSVAGTEGYAAVENLSIEDGFEYRVDHCDATGCASTSVDTGYVSALLGIGDRPGATTIPFTIDDTINATVDVGSGNLQVESPQLTLSRVAGDLSVGAVYNSISRFHLDDFDGSLSSGWRLSTGSDVYLDEEPITGAITYHGPNGTTGLFFAGSSGAYDSPPGFKMDLAAAPGGGWTLWDHGSGQTSVFNSYGQLTQLKDRNDNVTTFGYSGASLTSIVGDQGPTDARTLTVSTAGSKRITGISQNPGYGSPLASRSVSYGYNTNGQLTSITDVLGRTTAFGYGASSGNLTSITAPGGAVTSFTYDELGRVQSITQPTATSATAITRFAYDATTTTVAEPNTDQGSSIHDVPHTTYTLSDDGNKLIASATDPAGKDRSATYTAFNDVASSTDPAGTTTLDHDANGGESLTGVTGASGATSSFSYGNSGTAQYLPSAGTDPQGNSATYSYDGAGNGLSAEDGGSNTASVTYNGDGTVATSTAPNGAVTTYGYNTDKQLTSLTPPSGTSLGGEAYTWDGYGRLATVTDGRGVVTTYSYDKLDRVTNVSYSTYGTTVTGVGDVSYSYDTAGYLDSRTDDSGTTTYGHDPLGRLTARSNTANAGGVSYSYDKTGNLASATNAYGTTTYSYDDRNLVTAMTPADSRVIRFGYDDAGRRVDTWFNTNTATTVWAAHSHTDYDAAGHITRIWTAQASDDASRVADTSFSYYGDTDGGYCPTAPAADTALRWVSLDNLTGVYTNYCYDTSNRLSYVNSGAGSTFVYTYDADGNRIHTDQDGSTVQTQTVNAADQLTDSGYSYDAAGNELTGAYGAETWNAAGQMITLTTGTGAHAYSYAGVDQTELITDGVGRNYTYGRTGATGLPLVESFTQDSSTFSYLYDPQGTPLAIEGGNTHYLALDALGSVVATINHSGTTTTTYSYDAWGNQTETAQNGSAIVYYQLFGYTGGITDPIDGLLHLGHRWYDSHNGRFTQRDDIDTLADPSRANRYQYASSNPINYLDPTGRFDWGALGDVLSFASGCGAAVTTLWASGYGDLALAFGGFFGGVVATLGACAVGGALTLNGSNYP